MMHTGRFSGTCQRQSVQHGCRRVHVSRRSHVVVRGNHSDPVQPPSVTKPENVLSWMGLSVQAIRGAACSAGIVIPNTSGSGGGYGGDGLGAGDGGGGDGSWGPGLQQLLYEIADSKRRKDDKPELSSISDLEESQEESPEGENPWKSLVTDTEEYGDVPAGERKGTNRCVEVVIEGWPDVPSLPSKYELRGLLQVQEGHVFDEDDIRDDKKRIRLQYEEYIRDLQVETQYVDDKSNHQRVVYRFKPFTFKAIDSVEIVGANSMPEKVNRQLCESVLPKESYNVAIGIVEELHDKIEDWYQKNGLPYCYVASFEGLDEGVLRARVIEAKIADVKVRFQKKDIEMEEEDEEAIASSSEGEVVPPVKVLNASGLKSGMHYQMEDIWQATNNIYASGVFEHVDIDARQSPQDVSKLNVTIRVKEVEPKSMDMELDWALKMNRGIPQLSRQTLIPGGSVSMSHENVFGNGESVQASFSSSDWRNPAPDINCTFSYSEPFYAPYTTRNFQVFQTQKLNPMFTGKESEVPQVVNDRFGIKGWIAKVGSGDDKMEHAMLLQRISTRTTDGQPLARGPKVVRGYLRDNGPPTTLSPSGTDHSLSYQGYCLLDNVQYVNGSQIGRRATFQVDQGLNLKVPLPLLGRVGFSGGLYNKAQLSYTNFSQLPGVRKLTVSEVWAERKAPMTLVVHGKVGNIIGDAASYEAFALGGPYSVRGYGHGEIGAGRRFLEAAAEVRLPLKNVHKKLPGIGYVFTEYGSDLGSSKTLPGHPSEFYRKAGRGASVGIGLKTLGACRVEYARDLNSGTGTVLVNWGERF